MKANWDKAAADPDFCWCGERQSPFSPAFDEDLCWECWAKHAREENLCLLCGVELKEPRLRICRSCAKDGDI